MSRKSTVAPSSTPIISQSTVGHRPSAYPQANDIAFPGSGATTTCTTWNRTMPTGAHTPQLRTSIRSSAGCRK